MLWRFGARRALPLVLAAAVFLIAAAPALAAADHPPAAAAGDGHGHAAEKKGGLSFLQLER